MVFSIAHNPDKTLNRLFKASMKSLNRFYGIDWREDMPRVFVMPDRKTIDALSEKKTERWIVGFNDKRYIFFLDNAHMEQESSHKKYSPKKHAALINHELCHAFFNKISNGQTQPKWLNEGVSLFVSGQIKFRPEKFKEFLGYFEHGGKGIYAEAGPAVELLVANFGKRKLLTLIKQLEHGRTRRSFATLFKKIYGFTPTYKNFNDLLS